eukprot:1138361-Pelagomonas_calceolata.AAC.1
MKRLRQPKTPCSKEGLLRKGLLFFFLTTSSTTYEPDKAPKTFSPFTLACQARALHQLKKKEKHWLRIASHFTTTCSFWKAITEKTSRDLELR